jgi:hypothetical protein
VDALEDHRQRRVRQDRPDGQDAQQRDAVVGEAALEDARDPGLGDHVDLVDDRPGDLDAVRPEQRRVEDDLVDGPADAALADDHRGRPQHPRDDRVRQPDDGPDPGVPRALDEQDLVVVVRGVSRPELRPQVLHDIARDVRLREAARDVDGAHHRVRLGQAERLLHEDGVLVGRLAIFDHRPLTDRLEEPGPEPTADEAIEQPQRGRGLAPVLSGGGEVQLPHGKSVAAAVRRR